MQSDARLTELAAAGHEQAFAVIVARHRPALERFCAGIVGSGRAEDAVQQAFVNAHTAMTTADPPRELRPWLYRIARNVSLNVLRGGHDESPLDDDFAAARSERPDAVAERSERFRTAVAAVAALPPAQRDAIVLRELEGRSHEEIATALGVSAGAARQYLFRARATVRAAATAITPQPLLSRLLEAGGTDHAVSAATAGAGMSAILAKSAAGLLAAGAVGGTAVQTGVVDVPGHRSAPSVVREAPSPAAAATAVEKSVGVAPASADAAERDPVPAADVRLRRAAAAARREREAGRSARSDDTSHAKGSGDRSPDDGHGRGPGHGGRSDDANSGSGSGPGSHGGSPSRGGNGAGADASRSGRGSAPGLDSRGSSSHGGSASSGSHDHGSSRSAGKGAGGSSSASSGSGSSGSDSGTAKTASSGAKHSGSSGSGSSGSGSGRDAGDDG